ncbi:MAG: hypothetical protein Q8N42_00260 [bacterium]|nr:hypothetical protein [bacterium]
MPDSIINFIKAYSLSVIWAIFAVLFFIMVWKEWRKSRRDLETLGDMNPSSFGQVKILGVDFSEMLNKFKNEINRSSKESHKIATTSYFLAGLTALASFIISLL